MVRISFSIQLLYDIAAPGCDFIFNVHAARTGHQAVVHEDLTLSQQVDSELFTQELTNNRYLRLRAWPGSFSLNYQATVELRHVIHAEDQVEEVPVASLPSSVLGYIYPSRYCQSDRLHKLAMREFGHLRQGYARVLAIRDWVNRRVVFSPATTNSNTSAVDTLLEEQGVCRDFAHLMIALCRAVNIPARFATGIDYGADTIWGAPDFHAYVEVYLSNRWYIFDPSGMAIPMALVRFGTGRDAADVSFATMFGTVSTNPPLISIRAHEPDGSGVELPYRRNDALSTDSEAGVLVGPGIR